MIVAEGFPPGVQDFDFQSLVPPLGQAITKITLLAWLAAAIIIVFFLVAYRKPKLVPTKSQWLAESIYGFIRDGVSREVIGAKDGLRFAPYLATLFLFIIVMNVFGIVPFIQISPNSHIAFPAFLAIVTYVMFLYLGIRKHGFFGYIKHTLILPGVPWPMHLLLVPIEFVQNFLTRPVTLAVRLFANMFAGHLLLLVFTLGGVALMNAQTLWFRPLSVVSWAMAIIMTFFELIVAALQAYVFVVLTASYVQSSLAEDH
ncbi:F0F1 ATP synthase subunit A [Actinocatenispora rupis]|uniref:ATP synthase subunit a n=1 Tax=Actinocatenispora rupis TaxID=519421 RepID=A0A8J3J5U5_9ACTN|nr:F0F1 ATP synthase subunit A [Actinocatenispora rupis]GID12151.1 ATP synthase subunit a [Actinocatenispora rupis]